MEFKNILYEVKDGILYLTLNRPEVRNALSPEMWKDIQTAVEAAGNDDSVQVIIISGAGDKALASGADIQEIQTDSEDADGNFDNCIKSIGRPL